MFRTQANPMDDVVVKATDENLTSENWEYILDVCDRVSGSTSGPQQVIASLIRRLAHRNANVQLYTLELANALSQNCGPALHRELASKAFTDALLRLAAERNTHAQVKQKVLERMGTWTEEFRSSPELGIMEQAYGKLRVQQPGLMPPGKPVKKEISREDRRKEDEELQMALALSVQDKGKSPPPQQQQQQASGAVSMSERDDSEAQPAPPGAQQGTTAATVSRVRALYDFTPSEPGELAFRKNDVIAVLESVYKDWWKGSLRGQTGIFPLNYVEKLQDPTKEELERDAQMEAEVFGEIRNVEKLLALLSVRGDGGGNGRRGEREEEEISDLYQRTLSIRPKLIELIGKYSQKKDDFTQLNERFIKARRDYEALLESSMSAPQYGQQQYPVRARQPIQPIYPPQQHQQPPCAQQPPPQGYPPQGPPPAQGYPTQPSFPPQASQQHLPHQPQDPAQRYFSPAPSEPPPSQPQQNFSSPYPQLNSPLSSQPPNGGPAPFHFIPGGVQGAAAAASPHQQLPLPQHDIRRKPSPQGPPIQPTTTTASGPSDPYTATPPGPNVPAGFQGQIRPNSIHTLNSGNPQELATGGYESPTDNRHSYPPAYSSGGGGIPPQPYDLPPQQQQQAPPPPQQRSDLDALPSRQRTQSIESPTGLYSPQPDASGASYSAVGGVAQQQPAYQPPYQAYQPQAQPQMPPPQQQRLPSGGSSAGDPSDYYR